MAFVFDHASVYKRTVNECSEFSERAAKAVVAGWVGRAAALVVNS